MLLDTGRYQVGSDGCSPDQMLPGTGGYQVGSDKTELALAKTLASRKRLAAFASVRQVNLVVGSQMRQMLGKLKSVEPSLN